MGKGLRAIFGNIGHHQEVKLTKKDFEDGVLVSRKKLKELKDGCCSKKIKNLVKQIANNEKDEALKMIPTLVFDNGHVVKDAIKTPADATLFLTCAKMLTSKIGILERIKNIVTLKLPPEIKDVYKRLRYLGIDKHSVFAKCLTQNLEEQPNSTVIELVEQITADKFDQSKHKAKKAMNKTVHKAINKIPGFARKGTFKGGTISKEAGMQLEKLLNYEDIFVYDQSEEGPYTEANIADSPFMCVAFGKRNLDEAFGYYNKLKLEILRHKDFEQITIGGKCIGDYFEARSFEELATNLNLLYNHPDMRGVLGDLYIKLQIFYLSAKNAITKSLDREADAIVGCCNDILKSTKTLASTEKLQTIINNLRNLQTSSQIQTKDMSNYVNQMIDLMEKNDFTKLPAIPKDLNDPRPLEKNWQKIKDAATNT